MKKKTYIAPSTVQVMLKVEGLLAGESMNVDSTNKVTNDNQVFSRGQSGWENDD